jgi:undecaprenyl-diphosphatase
MEEKILFLINRQWTGRGLDLFMAVMSSFDFWLAPLAVAAVCAFVFGGFRARAAILCGGIIIGIGEGAISGSLKKIVGRPRPHETLAEVRRVELADARPRLLAVFKPVRVEMSPPQFGAARGHSFPSSHTMNNFSAAVVLAFFYRRRGWLYFIPAACVGYSRIYVGVHWPSDVLASVFLAAGWSLLALALLEFLWRKYGAGLMPRTFSRHPSLLEGAPA